MKNILPSKIMKMVNFKSISRNLVGIDMGSSSFKIACMRTGQQPSLLFYSYVELPESHDDSYVSEAIKKALKESGFSSKNAALSFTDESVISRRIELPQMPQNELIEALRWKAKDAVHFDISNASIGYEVLSEFQKEDGSKVMEVICTVAAKEAVDKRVKVLKDAGLNVIAVNMTPFGLENIAKASPLMDASKTIFVMDFGHTKTEVSVLKNKTLEFVRSLPLGSRNISDSLRPAIQTEKGDVTLSKEAIEDFKRRLGITYEEVMLENGVSSRQLLSLMRPVLEQLSKELRRSIDYYMQEFGKDEGVEVYLIGDGSRLKNLDRYLAEELNVPVKKMAIPPSIDTSRVNLNNDDSLSLVALIGVMMGCKKSLNLLPQEYEVEKIEFIEKISLRMTAIIAALILLFSFIFIKLGVNDYTYRLMTVPMQKNILWQIKAIQDKVREREAFLANIESKSINYEYIMKELSNIIPSNVVLESLSIEQNSKTLNMKGVVYGSRSGAQSILAKFMEELEKSRSFKDAQLSSIQGGKSNNEEISVFEITCFLE